LSLKGSKINAGFFGAMMLIAALLARGDRAPGVEWFAGALGLEAIFVGIAIYVHRTKTQPPQS
jgi:hypothetical protein